MADDPGPARSTIAGPTISVVIPTYQRREPVLAAIASVIDQETPAAEILVVDDGSTDGTADAIAAAHGDKVHVVRQTNRGVAAARNTGSRAAHGDAVAFLDSDNRWLPHHLTVISGLLDRHPTAVLVGTQRRFRTGAETVEGSTLEDLGEALLLAGARTGYVSSVAVRRDALAAAGMFDEQLPYGEDIDLFVRLGLVGGFVLISTHTLERGVSADSMRQRALATGGYAPLLSRSAQSATALLDRLGAAETDPRRRAAHARAAIGRATAALAAHEPRSAVAAHVAEAVVLAPSLLERTDWLVAAVRWSGAVTDDDRHLRLLMASELWPERRGPLVTSLRAAALREALRQRAWRQAARSSGGLVRGDGLRLVWQRLSRRSRR